MILPVPFDMVILSTSGAIGGYREADNEREELIVSATGPGRVDQRLLGESVEDWLIRGNWLTAGRGEPIATTYREVLLPAGSSLEVTAGYRFGDGDRWTMLHVVDTGQGYAVLQFDGGGPTPEMASEEIRLMRELVEFRPWRAPLSAAAAEFQSAPPVAMKTPPGSVGRPSPTAVVGA